MLMWRSVKTSRTSSWPARPSECCLDTNQHHHWTWTWHDGRLAQYENVFKCEVKTIYHTNLARQGTWDVQGANCCWERWPTWLCCEEGMQLHGDRHSGLSHTSLKLIINGCSLSNSRYELWKIFKCSLLISEKSFQTCGDSLEGECFTHNEVDLFVKDLRHSLFCWHCSPDNEDEGWYHWQHTEAGKDQLIILQQPNTNTGSAKYFCDAIKKHFQLQSSLQEWDSNKCPAVKWVLHFKTFEQL